MCLALPMRIVSIDDGIATIIAGGLEQRASLVLVPDAKPGDSVLVHAGFALSVIDEEDAAETLALFAEIAACADEPTDGDAGGS
jgi:hydrogenase expression/formation protein HypC